MKPHRLRGGPPLGIEQFEVDQRQLRLPLVGAILVRVQNRRIRRRLLQQQRIRSPLGVPVFAHVHLGERADVPDADQVHGEVAEKVDDGEALVAEGKVEDEGRDHGTEELLEDVTEAVLEERVALVADVGGVGAPLPRLRGVVDLGDDQGEEVLGEEDGVLVGDAGPARGDNHTWNKTPVKVKTPPPLIQKHDNRWTPLIFKTK